MEVRDAVRSALADAGQLESVIAAVLYGSNARGEAGPESDLDVLVVTGDDDSVPPVQEALLDAAEVLRQRFGIPLSAYVVARERVQERFRDGDPLMETIADEGRELIGGPFREIVETW